MQPKSIGRAEGGLQITWDDGHESVYPIRYLRRFCPCAVCREIPGYDAENLIPEALLPSRDYDVKSAQPVGWYALQFQFNDDHDTGIYSYDLLRKRCVCEQCSAVSAAKG